LDEGTERAIAEAVFNQVINASVGALPESAFLRRDAKVSLLRHKPVQTIHAVKFLIRALAESRGAQLLVKPLPPELVRETASVVKQSSAIAEKLMSLLRSADRRTDA